MRFSATFTAALLPVTALAGLVTKRDDVAITDQYLFDISLDDFIANRDAGNPSTLNFESDGCSDSPDNPLGFNFEPACYRHDFGYANYRAQARFTKAAKKSIDSNFLEDLEYQCEEESWLLESVCDALAQVYYTAVKAFGGSDATKRSFHHHPGHSNVTIPFTSSSGQGNDITDWAAEYEAKLAEYNALVEQAKTDGSL